MDLSRLTGMVSFVIGIVASPAMGQPGSYEVKENPAPIMQFEYGMARNLAPQTVMLARERPTIEDVVVKRSGDDGVALVTATVTSEEGLPVTSVVVTYGDRVSIVDAPSTAQMVEGESVWTAEVPLRGDGVVQYLYVSASNADGVAHYPVFATQDFNQGHRSWLDAPNYAEDSRIVHVNFEDGDPQDKSDAMHQINWFAGTEIILDDGANGTMVADMDGGQFGRGGELLGGSIGASDEFTMEMSFSIDDFREGTPWGNWVYLINKPGSCAMCWDTQSFGLLWGRMDNANNYLAARFWNDSGVFERDQVAVEIQTSMETATWYHAVLQVEKAAEGSAYPYIAVLQLMDGDGVIGHAQEWLAASPLIGSESVYIGRIGDRTFVDGRIDDIAFYNYAHYTEIVKGVKREQEVPDGYSLQQNYPNPFNHVTTIGYSLPIAGHASLEVFDLLGRKVATVVDGVEQAGVNYAEFDARSLSSGVYRYRMVVDGFRASKMLTVVN